MGLRRAVPLLLCLWLIAAPYGAIDAADEPIAVVIGDAAAETLSPEMVRLIFERKRLIAPSGQAWIPVNLPAADPTRRAFSQAVFDAMPEEQEDYWNQQYFHGINPPDVLGSEEAVLRFVATTPGAIGYVRAALADGRVKVVSLIASASTKSR